MKKHHFVFYQANDEPRDYTGWKMVCESCGSWVQSQVPSSAAQSEKIRTIETMKVCAVNSYPEDCEEAWIQNIARDIHNSLMILTVYESQSCCQHPSANCI